MQQQISKKVTRFLFGVRRQKVRIYSLILKWKIDNKQQKDTHKTAKSYFSTSERLKRNLCLHAEHSYVYEHIQKQFIKISRTLTQFTNFSQFLDHSQKDSTKAEFSTSLQVKTTSVV